MNEADFASKFAKGSMTLPPPGGNGGDNVIALGSEPPEDDDEIAKHTARINDLQSQLGMLKQELNEHASLSRRVDENRQRIAAIGSQSSAMFALRPEIFLAKFTGPASFNEAAISSGGIVTHSTPRASNGTDSFAAKLVPMGTQIVFSARDGSNGTAFFIAASRSCVVKITGNASGGGKYNGRLLTGNSTATASGALAMPEGMIVPGSDNSVVLNYNEDGASTHNVNTGTFFGGTILAMTTDTPPKYLIGINSANGTSGFTGVITRVTGVTYNTTTHILAYQSSNDTYTSGAFISTSANSDTTVDTAGAC